MIIEIFADNLIKEDIKNNTLYKTSTAIVLNDDKILLEHAIKRDFYMLPGGGVENDETFEKCAKREVLEETGYIVKPLRQSVIILEHYPNKSVESHYFICELLSDKSASTNRTDKEKKLEIENKWLDLVEALTILDSSETSDELGLRFMQRDFLAIINSV